jgi:hypothetical protein
MRNMRRLIFIILTLFLASPAFAGVDLRCYPNPAVSGRDEVKISIHPPADGEVSVRIYSIDGFPVRELIDNEPVNGGGAYVVASWDMKNDGGETVSPGAYLVKLDGDFSGENVTEKFVLIVDI